MEQFHHFGTVFAKEDRETGAEAVFVYATKSQRATRQSATWSRDKVAHSRDRIARRNRTCDIGLK